MIAKIAALRQKIQNAAIHCGRDPKTIRLVAVTKTQPVQRVQEAISTGIDVVGENYIQEAQEKYAALCHQQVQWHFIGHLQSNKSKYAVRIFELIHSVDSLKLAAELNKCAAKIGKIQKILIQVNIAQELSKSGVETGNALGLIRQIAEYGHISVRGLMTMPPFFDEPEKARPYFKVLRHLKDQIAAEKIPGVLMDELSMGMTGDFEAAIEEGATLVRIGTAIFGERRR